MTLSLCKYRKLIWLHQLPHQNQEKKWQGLSRYRLLGSATTDLLRTSKSPSTTRRVPARGSVCVKRHTCKSYQTREPTATPYGLGAKISEKFFSGFIRKWGHFEVVRLIAQHRDWPECKLLDLLFSEIKREVVHRSGDIGTS